ncbi:hypothetical protein C9446_00750 [Providencia heimbachae]|uniref:hypothetical protein n=1 Tax=Providencia heimbachae TaxID=333962 RepID=UPI0010BF3E91|nr:hypothetical protein [Providencia heimbachae]QCJ68523.1 hypothetical protein C9446_00750 [Providencia heimbachae]
MQKSNRFNHLLRPMLTLIFMSLLFGCANFTKNIKSKFNIKGDVYSQSKDIPENSDITLSITNLDITHSIKSSFDFHFKTTETNRTVSFSINLPDELVNSPHQLGASVRIEKEGELIMMSNKIIEIPINYSEKLSLPIIPIQ